MRIATVSTFVAALLALAACENMGNMGGGASDNASIGTPGDPNTGALATENDVESSTEEAAGL